MKITIIYPTEPSYVYGLIDGLRKNNLIIDLISVDKTQFLANKFENVNVINLRGDQNPAVGFHKKILRVIKFYLALFSYIIKTDSVLIHIHFANKFPFLDYSILNIFYKLFKKKIIYTAHNINLHKREGKTSFYYNFRLKILYKLVDHIIVHNNFSKRELLRDFKIKEDKVSVFKLGLNIYIPQKGISKEQARAYLSISQDSKTILFFGGLDTYKGVDILIKAFQKINLLSENYILIIAGAARDIKYTQKLENLINHFTLNQNIILKIGFIPDDEVENYFVAADCLVLPYRNIYQSGVHALSYSFGLPIIATNVGSFKEEDIIEGFNGFICEEIDPYSIQKTIMKYFNSDIYKNLDRYKLDIINWSKEVYSWDTIGMNTYLLYKEILK